MTYSSRSFIAGGIESTSPLFAESPSFEGEVFFANLT